MKVHSRLRIPSERFSSLTRRMTRKSRKNVMDTDAFSESYTQKQDLIKREKYKIRYFSLRQTFGSPQSLAWGLYPAPMKRWHDEDPSATFDKGYYIIYMRSSKQM